MKLIEFRHLKDYYFKLVFDNNGVKITKETNLENLLVKNVPLDILNSASLDEQNGNLCFSNDVIIDSNKLFRSTKIKNPQQEILYFCEKLKSYKDFIEFTERHWKEEVDKYKNLDWNKRYDRYGERDNLDYLLSDDYPQYQRKSHLVMLLSLFEDFLNQLCASIQEKFDLKVSFTDLNGMGLERAKNYFNKCTKLQFPANQNTWGNIKNAQEIRNSVVHTAGHIEKGQTLKIVTANDFLDSEDYARTHLVLMPEYLFGLIKDMQAFNSLLLKSVEGLCNDN